MKGYKLKMDSPESKSLEPEGESIFDSVSKTSWVAVIMKHVSLFQFTNRIANPFFVTLYKVAATLFDLASICLQLGSISNCRQLKMLMFAIVLLRRLLQQSFMGLGEAHCSQPSRDAGLGIIEAILGYGDDAAELVLRGHLEGILKALQGIATKEHGLKSAKSAGKPKEVSSSLGMEHSIGKPSEIRWFESC